MTDLQIFNSPEFGAIRTIEKDGKPWFVGKDVAVVLGYGDTDQALRKHIDDEDTLQNIESMKTDVLIDEETGENYTYTSSIDELTYNQIRLYYDNEESGTRELYIAKDSSNINRWGVLQYTEQLNDPTSGQVKADALLEYYNKVTRGLDISGCVMKGKLQAGNSVGAILNLGDVKIQNYMVAEKVTHHITTDHWSADLRLIGGEFI